MTAPTTAVAVQTAPPSMTFPQKLSYAKELADSGLLPSQFRKQPASVLWAVEYGEALGLRGVVAMSSIHVIEGKPAPSAAMAAGLIRARGHRLRVYLTPRTQEHEWGTAVAELTRADDPDFTFRAEWSAEDAIRAEICKLEKGQLLQWSSKHNKWVVGNWQKYPRQMMKARVLGEVSRDGATDVLLGLHYLAEELDGAELDSNGQIVSSGPAPSAHIPDGGSNPRPVGAHITNPVIDADVVEGVELVPPGDESGPLTDATRNKMMGLFRRAGIGSRSDEDRAKRLRVAEILTDRELTSSTELTEGDGLVIVEALRTADDPEAYALELLDDDAHQRAAEAAMASGGADDTPTEQAPAEEGSR